MGIVRRKLEIASTQKASAKFAEASKYIEITVRYYLLANLSEETDNFFLPFLLRAFKTALPFLVAILLLKPCLFLLFLNDG